MILQLYDPSGFRIWAAPGGTRTFCTKTVISAVLFQGFSLPSWALRDAIMLCSVLVRLLLIFGKQKVFSACQVPVKVFCETIENAGGAFEGCLRKVNFLFSLYFS